MTPTQRQGRGADVRLGEVVLGDVEKAARDGLEGPELGEPEAFEVDDDERLAYWSAGGGGRGWEDLGEDGLDVDEDRAPVFLRGYALVEPLGAYRPEALDVYRTAELYTMEWSDVGTDRRRARTEFTLSVWKESGDQQARGMHAWTCAWAPSRRASIALLHVRTLWKPIGQLSKTPSRPGNCVAEQGRTERSDVFRKGAGGGRTAHIERIYAPVKLLYPDIFHRAPPVDAIKDHLLRLGRIVSAGLQEAPVCATMARQVMRKKGR